MSVKTSDIGWGKYSQWEGPYYRGHEKGKYVEPSNPTWEDSVLTIFQATEGGNYSAYNGYDRCISTSGLIQWCEAGQYSVSDMLGLVAERGLSAIDELAPALKASNASFLKNGKGKWRFVFNDSRGEVDRIEEQKQLFLLSSSGLIGSWDEQSKAHARLWASCISSVWTYPDAIQAQKDFTIPRLMWFVTKEAKEILFGDDTPSENEGWTGAVRAGYISFAGNLPAVASKSLLKAVRESKAPKFSEDWCISVLKSLTFSPQIAIYPNRYKSIRPHLERLFDVDLPDFSSDLQAWKETFFPDSTTDTIEFSSVTDYQEELILEGYSLGPSGADGVIGKLTKEAIIQFQQLHGLVPDGVIGPKTRQAFIKERESRQNG